ncbi:MAG TPA: protein kinase [Pyrinomonadaceae bacterium]|jgi:serine/threonine protein kinase|nr:protein kinase [Pyrinomonadaceae bacterium]
MISPGTLLQHRYLVERQIGQGGMGAVYVATDQRFGSTVALKETFFDDPSLRRAFEREARLLNRLRHPALPRVSDHFNESDGQFLVMEYIEGSDLSDMLKERGRAFPSADVLAWADQLLDALEYLHAQEPPVIHRDIKPQNIKLVARNQVVLLDFGLAKGSAHQTLVTNTGSVFGYSFNYAPIEQMQGSGTDPRSDLYSLGATLYHLLTGTPPPDALTRATAVLAAQPDPLRPADEVEPGVPASVAPALARSLALSAAQRYASAAEMREALKDAGRATIVEASGGAHVAATLASEQATQLIQPADRDPTSPPAAGARATNVAGTSEAATVLNPDAAPTSAHVSRDRPDHDSVVTRVGAAQPAPRGRRLPSLALGVAVGLAALVAIAAGLYRFDRRADTPAAQPTPQAQTTPTPDPQPTDAVLTAQPSSTPAPAAPAATPALASQPKRAADSRDTNAEARNRPRPGEAVPPDAPPAGPPPPRPGEDADDDGPDPLRGRDLVNNPPTQEEMRRWAADSPRRARIIRRRLLEAHRRANEARRRQGLPPLPPPREMQPPE